MSRAKTLPSTIAGATINQIGCLGWRPISFAGSRPSSSAIFGNATIMAATTTISIVFVGSADPVRTGLLASLNHPGGNITGAVFASSDLAAKRLGLLHDLVPKSVAIAALFHPAAPGADLDMEEVEKAGQRLAGKS